MRALLKKKVDPNKMKVHKIKIREKPTTINDKTSEGYDRAKFLQRYKNRGITKPSIPSIIKEIQSKSKEATIPKIDIPKIDIPINIPKNKKKRGIRLTLGKKPTEGEPKEIKEHKEKTIRPPPDELVESTVLTSPNYKIIIGDSSIEDRLPKPDVPIKVRVSRYYLNNREFFVNFINSNFESYKISIDKESKEASCETKIGKFTPMAHQEIVRDYINLYTPYRGLLIYHGLGSGKTCASIGIAESYANIATAEGIKNAGEIIVMTPASLRRNYINDLKKCGDPMYRLNQFWEFLPTNNDEKLISTLSHSLKLSVDTIRKNKGAWYVDIKKGTKL